MLEKLVGSRYQILAEILRKKKECIKAEDICRSFRIKDVQILETLQNIFSCKIKIAKVLHIKDKIEKEYKNKPDPFSCGKILMIKSCQEFKNILNETMEIVKIEYADAINNDIYLLHELNLLCQKFILNSIGLKEMIPDFYDMQIDFFYKLYDESRYNESFYKKLPIDVLLMFRNKAMYDIHIPYNISGVNNNQNNIVSDQTGKLVHKISKQNAYNYIKMINTKKFYESCFSIMIGCSIMGSGILIVSLIILLAIGNSFFIC